MYTQQSASASSFKEQGNGDDIYNNLTNNTVQQSQQLNLTSLMPANWNNTAIPATTSSSCPQDDWSRYTVSRDGVQRYISASGANRFSVIERNSGGRRFGQPNLLRSQPPAALTMGSSPWFNTSSDREVIVNPSMRDWVGCRR